ncbi:MAG TPA: universal stress protein [Kofleriaceae bacterium]|nr:universal stress protein [Kofleriaceae bacterium]
MDILVCLEGSPSTERAIEVAFAIALELRHADPAAQPATLVGLAIVDEPDIVAGAATSIGGASFRKDRDAALLDDARARARGWLDALVARGRAAGVTVRALELAGRPAELILAEAPRHDLIVLGRDVNFRFETQDRDRYTRDRVLRRAGRPILVVPEPLAITGTAAMVCYDGSPAATRALHSFAGSGLARGRQVHVATVHDDGATAFEIAARGCALLAERGVHALPENVVSTESITGALLTRRAALGAGLIVLGGYVPSPLARLVWGSVTHELLEHTVVPVFLHY